MVAIIESLRAAIDTISRMPLQPLVNYKLTEGWYLTSPVITTNWQADSDDAWTIPIGGGFGRVVRIGELPVNFNVQGFYNVEKLELAPDWAIRFQFAFLFPRG